MNRSIRIFGLFCLLVLSGFARASQPPMLAGPGAQVRHGANLQTVTSARDSIYLIGPWSSSAAINGQFEDQSGLPDWNGWTHHDVTVPEATRWQVSTFQADNLAGHGEGNLAAWCGESRFLACYANDEDGGYGNNYHEVLTWTGTVADPESPCTVTVDAWLNLHLEFGYDFLYLRYHRQGDVPQIVWYLDGQESNNHLQESFVVQPGEYLGEPGLRNQVKIDFQVTSDGAYSDEDCFFPSTGACQVDDITVTLDNGDTSSFEDFESGEMGAWQAELPIGVGDYAQILSNIDEIDPCFSNYSPQVIFIDDGNVVPESEGEWCLNWCYGPGGYIVNTQGGLAGSDYHLHNQIRSPVIQWPASGAEGAILTYGVYEHEDLGPDSPGIFHTWHLRSTASTDPADLELASWRDRNYVYYGPGQYIRPSRVLTDLLVPGTTYAQVELGVWEIGYLWGVVGDDGYPAPYYDNVQLVAFPAAGPSISARTIDLAQDGFPANGFLDQEDPGNNSVRFDMARNIAPASDYHLDPGDSIVVSVSVTTPGGNLLDNPRLWYSLEPNPVFDPYRTSGLPNAGYVRGAMAPFDPQLFSFDLPDTGFFYPGDVLHYYIEATSGSGAEQHTATLPADTTGFADFSSSLSYDTDFTVRALPTVFYNPIEESLDFENQVLLWEDGGDLETWIEALDGIGFLMTGVEVFQTRGPSSGEGNGLGSRATPAIMSGYRTLLYSSGILGSSTICNGDYFMDGSDDVGLLDAWLNQGDKSMFLTGDNLVSDLDQSGAATQAFATNWMKVNHVTSDIRPLIDNQVAPVVLTHPDGMIFFSLDGWVAYGGCPYINTFDGLSVLTGGVRIAEFADPGGNGWAYDYAAAVMNDLPEDKTVIPDHNSAVITLPYDFRFIYTDPNNPPPGPPHSARERVLLDVLYFFGEIIIWDSVDLPGSDHLEARNYPNPFNPITRIEYSLPKAGHLSVKVFNVRGQLVRTLIDEKREAGSGNVLWDGADDRGAAMSSGVYFYEVRSGSEVIVQKMALLK